MDRIILLLIVLAVACMLFGWEEVKEALWQLLSWCVVIFLLVVTVVQVLRIRPRKHRAWFRE